MNGAFIYGGSAPPVKRDSRGGTEVFVKITVCLLEKKVQALQGAYITINKGIGKGAIEAV